MNKKRLRGYTTKERKLIKRAAKTGVMPDVLRITLGSRLIPIIASATGNFGGAAIGAAGSIAARGVASKAAVSRASDVLREITKDIGKNVKEGTKATNKSGQKLIYKDGKWRPQ